MKILWIVNNINQVGGIERVVINLSNYFISRGIEVFISSLCSKGGNPYFSVEDGVKITHENKTISSRLSLFRAVYNVIKKSDADIVIGCHGGINNAIVSCKPLLRGRKKIIVTQHCSYDFDTKSRRILNSVFHRRADAFLVLTESDKAFWNRYRMKNCKVMPNAVVNYPTKTASMDCNVIISAGRLTDVKGFDFLIKAFAAFHKTHPNWKLRILGDGEERGNLESLANRLGLTQSVELPGFTSNVMDEYAHSSVFALTSRSEGFSMVLLEAMSCGLPVISVDLPASHEILGQNAGVISARDENIFAENLSKMVEDKCTLTQYGQRAIEQSKCFSIEKIGESWIELFNELLRQ